jgi:hypothetical protein
MIRSLPHISNIAHLQSYDSLRCLTRIDSGSFLSRSPMELAFSTRPALDRRRLCGSENCELLHRWLWEGGGIDRPDGPTRR